MCDFLAANLELCTRMLNTAWQTTYTEEDVKKFGRRIWTMTRLFNAREGFSKQEDTIPPRIHRDPLPEGRTKGKVVTQQDFEKMLSEYYKLWGWDDQGIPTKETTRELGLSGLIET